MPIIESIAVDLASELVLRVVEIQVQRVLTKDNLLDALNANGLTPAEARKARRQLEAVADDIAERLSELVQVEARGLAVNEANAALHCVQESFSAVQLNNARIVASDLDATTIEKLVLGSSTAILDSASLDEKATFLYRSVVRECCNYIVDLALSIPAVHGSAFRELLRRETLLLDLCREILSRIPESDHKNANADSEFELQYRRGLARRLDHLELFGVHLEESSRRYPLTVAYISLTAEDNSPSQDLSTRDDPSIVSENVDRASFGGSDEEALEDASTDSSERVESAVTRHNRLLIKGEAGSGKTTLLQWIAVACSRGIPEDSGLADLDGFVPVFIQLRRFVDKELPTTTEFVAASLPVLAPEAPQGWMQRRLAEGRVVLLVDGVDELAERRRDEVSHWLDELVGIYPDIRVIVTSRPPAVAESWSKRIDYAVTELQPMSSDDIQQFVTHWHNAAADTCSTDAEREALAESATNLAARIEASPGIRGLATSPLLCAMLCALNRERRAQLPEDRMELYRIALEMLLDRRDVERQVDSPGIQLTYKQKLLLLQDIAFWMAINELSDAPKEQCLERLDARLKSMPRVKNQARHVLKYLLLRSGVLREPSWGRVDFIHRTFLEYLAAKEAIDQQSVNLLINNAHDDQWREVIILACGHANQEQLKDLLNGLMDRGERESGNKHKVHLLAVGCLETAQILEQHLGNRVNGLVKSLVPPRSMGDAKALSSAGDLAVPLLAPTDDLSAVAAAASVRALSLIATPAAMRMLTQYAADRRKTVVKELVRAWAFFDADQYADQVLRRCLGTLYLSHPRQVAALIRVNAAPSVDLSAPLTQSVEPLSGYRGRAAVRVIGSPIADLSTLLSLPNLYALDLERCGQIEDFEPLAQMKTLSWLDVSSTRIRSLTVVPKSLRVLRALSCSVLNTLAGIEDIKPLAFLYVSSSQLTDLSALASKASLNRLDLIGGKVKPVLPVVMPSIGSRMTLANVVVQDWRFLSSSSMSRIYMDSVEGPAPDLRNLKQPSVEEIEIIQCDFDGKIDFPYYTRSIRVEGFQGETLGTLPGGIQHLTLANCPNLRHLTSEDDVKLTPFRINRLSVYDCPNLKVTSNMAKVIRSDSVED